MMRGKIGTLTARGRIRALTDRRDMMITDDLLRAHNEGVAFGYNAAADALRALVARGPTTRRDVLRLIEQLESAAAEIDRAERGIRALTQTEGTNDAQVLP